MDQGTKAYRIPIIPYDLRRVETVFQFTDAMEHLTNVSNDVFNRYSLIGDNITRDSSL